jgi:hypothetical protein
VPTPRFHGLYGYQEIIDSLVWGLGALGHEVSASVNAFEAEARNIVFGFQMMTEAQIARLPAETIIYNFEQIAGMPPADLKPIYVAAAKRLTIWEYSAHNLPTWQAMTPAKPVRHVPVGFAPVLARIASAPVEDIDVLFYGLPAPRRLAVFDALCQTGVRAVFACGLYGASRDDLISRARLILNVSHASFRVFEVVRVSYLLANAKAVIAEREPDTFVEPDLRDAVAFTPPAQTVAMCHHFLQNEAARMALAQRGAAAIRKRDIRGILETALAADGE